MALAGYETAYTSPRNDILNIVKKKGAFNQGIADNNEAAKNSARDDAVQYYANLRNNGYGDLADRLSKSNYDEAVAILAEYPAETKSSVTTTGSANNTDGTANAKSLIELYKSYTSPESGSQVSSKMKDNADSLFKQYTENSAQTQAQSQTLSNNTYKYLDDIFSKGNEIHDYNLKYNPYTSDIGKSILSQYQLGGETAANEAISEIASGNGGNIDSYAAANAKRQQLAYTNAGNEAVLNDFNNRVLNAVNVLDSLGINGERLLGVELNNIANAQSANNNLLGAYNTAIANTAASEATDNDNIYKLLSSYLGAEADKYATDASLEGTKYNADTNKTINETSENAATDRTKLQAAADEALAKMQSDLEKVLADKNNASAEEIQRGINYMNYQIQLLANSGIITQTEANKKIAEIQANAEKYGYDTNYNINAFNQLNADAQEILLGIYDQYIEKRKAGGTDEQVKEFLIQAYPKYEAEISKFAYEKSAVQDILDGILNQKAD